MCEGSVTLEVGDDGLEIVDSFCYLGDMISCRGGIEPAIFRDWISCAWRKGRELASLLVNHSILLKERAKVSLCMCEDCITVCCRNLGANGKSGRIASLF